MHQTPKSNMKECQKSFDELKQYLNSPPLLMKSSTDDELLMYVVVTFEAISLMLIWEEDKVQRSVYYVSQVLCDIEIRYFRIEKVVFIIMTTIQWLRPYFQAHLIKILTDLPLRSILYRLDTSKKMAKWAVELTEFDLSFVPRTSMKFQILVDFIIECTLIDNDQAEGYSPKSTQEPIWILHVDGASNAQGCGAGLTWPILTRWWSNILFDSALRLQTTKQSMRS